MSVQLDPSTQLGFNRPLTVVVKKVLNVRNNNSQPVAFKVKTTAPKLYCVRPNSGRIEPGQSVDVSVLLQPMKDDPPAGVKCKDKFLVQSTVITPERESINLQDIWNLASPETVHQQKVKVVFLPPEGEVVPEANEPMEVSMDNSRFTDDLSQFGTVRGSSMNGHPNVLDSFVPIHRSSSQSFNHNERSPSPAQGEYIIAHEDTTQHETHYDEPPQPTSTPPGVVNINVHTPASEKRGDDGIAAAAQAQLQSKYVEAQDEIARLKALVASLASGKEKREDAELRRRNRAMSDDGTFVSDSIMDDETVIDGPRGGLVSAAQDAGVPLQVVIIIALGVFVTTYLFF